MYISADEKKEGERTAREGAVGMLIVSLFFLAFGLIYEYHSFGVYSAYMYGAFMIPLIFGALVFTVLRLTGTGAYASGAAGDIYLSGVITLTVYSVMKGALLIYGTDNPVISVYLYAGSALMAAGTGIFLIRYLKIRRA